MNSFLLRVYDKLILARPVITLSFLAAFLIFLAFRTPDFRLDASAESLVLENDEDLRYHRVVSKKYGTSDFLIITYTPFDDLLSENSLKGLKNLRDDLLKLPRVESVVNILDVPLLNSPKVKLSEIEENVRTLETPDINKDLARKEFSESPVYRKLLVSPDGKTTALLVNFKRDEKYFSLLYKRDQLRRKGWDGVLTAEEKVELEKVTEEFNDYLSEVVEYQSREVEAVRGIMDKQRQFARLFLGGVPMITSDIIDFIRHDLLVFGIGVLSFMIIVLFLFFRKKRWVALPICCCFISVVTMLGYLGMMDWRVTVISSNFISIMLIITLSLTIHLIVRYGELYAENPNGKQRDLVLDTVRHMFKPCLYTALTTIIAFSSLVVSDIRPVIDFGWMMTIGISMAFILSFVFFPATLVILDKANSVSSHDVTKALTRAIADFTIKHNTTILIFCSAIAIFSLMGVTRLDVENRFIDYFKSTTEIYRGMKVIDEKLGGTTPLDVIIQPDEDFFAYLKELENSQTEEDPFDDPFAEASDDGEKKQEETYWFHGGPLNTVEKIHDHLESMPEIGKVLSISTIIKVIKQLNDGQLPDDYDLALIKKLLPEKIKTTFVEPYLSDDGNEIRISMRIEEADPDLNRGDLIKKIGKFLKEEIGVEPDRVRFTGMAVLYNNMLHSLFDSQIQTIGTVFIGILLMFIILFRNVLLSFLAILPNVLAAGLVLGVMGWMDISLDMMTITIAAITIGIAVDDTIHYIYRFKEEFDLTGNYKNTINICHGSIGRAIYYTSITVTAGFGILILSDFIPTIYFGVLTGLAMIVALLNNLTLLPLLIMRFKPLGPEKTEELAAVAS